MTRADYAVMGRLYDRFVQQNVRSGDMQQARYWATKAERAWRSERRAGWLSTRSSRASTSR